MRVAFIHIIITVWCGNLWKFILLFTWSRAVNSLNFSGKKPGNFSRSHLNSAGEIHMYSFFVYRAQVRKFAERKAERPIHIVIT